MFTKEFIQQVKDLYDEEDHIIDLALMGKWELGRALRIGSDYTITHRDIIRADSLEDLQTASIKLQLRKQLYDDFMDGKGSIPSQEQAHQILSEEEIDAREAKILERIRRERDHDEKNLEEAG